MAIIRVRLCGEDRQRYGGDEPLPAELVLDTEQLKDLTAGELTAIERDTDVVLASVLPSMESTLPRVTVIRWLVAYLAMHQAGRPVTWAEFQPRLLRTEFVQEFDADPPAGPSGSSSEGAQESSSSEA